MKIGVVLPVLNQFKLAVDCLASVKTKYDWEPYIIPNYRGNKSVSDSWNEGISSALTRWCDYVLVANDDTILAPWTVDHMVKYMEDRIDSSTVTMVTGHNVRADMDSPYDILALEEPTTKLVPLDGPDFACFMVDRETIETVGWFDTGFNPAYFEDNDYHHRINLCGLTAVRLPSAIFYHYGSQTQNHDSEKPVVPSDQFLKNREYYIHKWGGVPGKETFAHPFNREPEPPAVVDEPIEIIGED